MRREECMQVVDSRVKSRPSNGVFSRSGSAQYLNSVPLAKPFPNLASALKSMNLFMLRIWLHILNQPLILLLLII